MTDQPATPAPTDEEAQELADTDSASSEFVDEPNGSTEDQEGED